MAKPDHAVVETPCGGRMLEFKHDVFVSFAWESEEHKDRVRILVGILRGTGLDVAHDETHVHLYPGMIEFVTSCVEDARNIVCACTPRWCAAFRGTDSHVHAWVREEASAIKQRGRSGRAWAWPVVFAGTERDDAVPPDLEARPSYTLPTDLSLFASVLGGRKVQDLHAVFDLFQALRATGAVAADPDAQQGAFRDAIDQRLRTRGAAFADLVGAHPLSRWAQRVTTALADAPNPLRLLEEIAGEILECLADAALPDAAFLRWAQLRFPHGFSNTRRPWVASIDLTESPEGFTATRAAWLRPGQAPIDLPGIAGPLADVPRLLATHAAGRLPKPAVPAEAVVRFQVPASGLTAKLHKTPARHGLPLGRTCRAVAVWPYDDWDPLPSTTCPGRGLIDIQDEPCGRTGESRLRVVRWPHPNHDLGNLLNTHEAHVLTVAVPDAPNDFATAWRNGDHSPPVHRAFDTTRAWLDHGRDVCLIWTDDQYPTFEPVELTQ